MEQLPEYTFFDTKVIQRAIKSGSLHRIKFLLNQGCKPNELCTPDCLRPLMLACYIIDDKKRDDIIQILLKAGALPGLVDKLGRSSLYHACRLGLLTTFELLLKADDSDLTKGDYIEKNTCLHVCAIYNRLELLKVLVQKMKRFGIDLNTKNNFGHTALSSAYYHSNMECFQYLHSEGALPRYNHIRLSRELSSRQHTLDRITKSCVNNETSRSASAATERTITPVLTHTASVTTPTPTINTIQAHTIQSLIAKSAQVHHHKDLYRSNAQQRPINYEWIEAVKRCRFRPRSSSPISFATVVSITARLKSMRSASARRRNSRPPSSTGKQ